MCICSLVLFGCQLERCSLTITLIERNYSNFIYVYIFKIEIKNREIYSSRVSVFSTMDQHHNHQKLYAGCQYCCIECGCCCIERRCRRIEQRVFKCFMMFHNVLQVFHNFSQCFTSVSWCFTSGSQCFMCVLQCFTSVSWCFTCVLWCFSNVLQCLVSRTTIGIGACTVVNRRLRDH